MSFGVNWQRATGTVFVVALAVLALGLGTGCGRAYPSGNVASGAATTSPQQPPQSSPSPSSGVLQAANCTGSSSGSNLTTTKPIGLDNITLKFPAAWSDHTNEVTGSGTLLFIRAPATYGQANATFMLQSIPFPRQKSSSHAQAIEDAASLAAAGSQSSVQDCTVGGDQASFYKYSDSAGNEVYRLLLIHGPSGEYPSLYRVVISSKGAADSQSASDIRAILGSWSWGA